MLLAYSVSINYAQQVPPCFTLSKTNGRFCVGEPITITNCIVPLGSVDKTSTYFFDLKNNPSDKITPINDNPFTKTYTKPGKYTIAQQGGRKADGITIDTLFLDIEILPIATPSISIGLCEGRKIEVIFTDTVYQSYTMTNGIDPDQIVPKNPPYTYTYPNTNPRIITVKGECNATFTSNQFVPIENLIPPDLISQSSQTFVNPNAKDSTTILLNGLGNMRYRVLQYQSGQWISINTISNINGLRSLPKYPLGNADEYFRVVSFDACGAADSSATLVIPKLTVVAENNQNLLNWTPVATPFLSEINAIQIIRNNIPIATLPANATNYTDINIICGRKYEYMLKIISNSTTLAGRSIESNNVPRSVTAISTNKPPAITNFNATVEGNNVKLTWDEPAGTALYYSIYRSESGKDYSLLNFSNYNSYIDKKSEANIKRYCYKITVTDSCQNTSDDSLITCNILLNSTKLENENHLNTWDKYINNTANPITYTIEVYNQFNKIIASFDVSADTSFTFTDVALDEPIYQYRVKTSDPLIPSKFYYSNYTSIKNDLLIFLPDAFTPNNDRDNDIFKAEGKYLRDFKLSVFNRWGEMIFYSENMSEGWDGKFKNIDCPPGVYVYVISALDNNNKEKLKKGSVILLK